MSITIEDQTQRLSLFHYNTCTENSSEDVKKTRGIIYDEEKNMVCSSYSFTPEHTVGIEAEKYRPLLKELDKCTIFRSEEGTLLRLFFDEHRWILSTHKRINAFDSKWSSSKSFGELFLDALIYYFTEGEGKGKLNIELPDDVFDQFCNRLDTKYVYTFLLRTNQDTKIVCDPPEFPTVYFAGLFEQGKWTSGNPTLLHAPEQKTFTSIEELEAYVEAVNPLEHQGVIVILPDGTTIKVVNPLCLRYKLVRGSEPDVRMSYFRLRKSDDDLKLFQKLFPRVNVEKMEEELFTMAKYLHRMYVRRYIKKQFTTIHPTLFYVMKQAHAWHCLDRSHNIVTLDKMMDVVEEQSPTQLHRMHHEFQSKQSDMTVDDCIQMVR